MKSDQICDKDSCWNKAGLHEQMFILLERDIAFAATVRFWAEERVRLGKNKAGDDKIVEALTLAEQIEAENKTKVEKP
jgi:hypothetical protein